MVFKKLDEISEEYKMIEPVVADEYMLGGAIQKWAGDFSDVVSPIRIVNDDGELEKFIVGKFALMDENTCLKVLDECYEAYGKGRGAWPEMSIEERLPYFYRFLEEFKKYRKEAITVLMWEIGKNIKDATAEFDRTVQYVEDSIEELKRMTRAGDDFIVTGGIVAQVKRSPLGVVFCLGPYNYPLNETFATVMPALLMGNTVLVKPPKRGGLIYKYVVKASEKTFPKGVFNVVFGRGNSVVEPIMKSGKVSVFGFIGTHKTANIISRMHPKPNRLKSVYGLDAKNKAIILPDADLETAVNETVLGTLSYNGQRCTAIKLIYVHEKVKDEFIKKYCEKVDSLTKGLPFDDATITPIIDERVGYFNELVEDALSKGAEVVNNPTGDLETFFYPKVLYPVNKTMRVFQEEQFGPVVPIMSFDDIEEPLSMIIESDFGQQCSIFGTDSAAMGKLIDVLVNQVSRVNINSQCQRGPDTLPFTGRKDSAVGTLSVSDALKTFSIRTLVTAKINDANKKLYKEIIANDESSFLRNEVLF